MRKQLDIAKVALEVCYGGDLDAWRRKESGPVSLRALASHKKLSINHSRLSRAIGVLEFNDRLPLADRPNVTVSHVFELIPLAAERQAALLAEIDSSAMSTRGLRDKLRAEANADARVDDNPPIVRAVRRVRRVLRKPETMASITAMSDEKRKYLADMFDEVQQRAGRLRPVLLAGLLL